MIVFKFRLTHTDNILRLYIIVYCIVNSILHNNINNYIDDLSFKILNI